MKYVNVNTDASFSHAYLLAGYAFHIHSQDFQTHQYGILKGNPRSSTEAEIMAIEYAIKVLLSQPNFKGTEQVVIFTDCRGAIGRIIKPKTELERRVHKLWKKLATKNGYAHLKHVKSHTTKEDIASIMNRWCDEKARRALQDRLSEK